MDWTWYLFHFEGRINRAKYWLAGLVIVCWMMFLALLMAALTLIVSGDAPGSFGFGIDDIFDLVDPASLRSAIGKFRNGELLSATIVVPQIFHAAGTLLFLWVYVATSIKRLHDRDKSHWWMVPFFVIPGLYQQFADRLGGLSIAAFFGLVAGILAIWGFVEMYCLRGSPWTNRFGANPLPKAQTRARGGQAVPRKSSAWDQQSEIEFVPHSAGPSGGPHVKRGA
jgi:uncharacterized membrane protein YhaH (DUF805 family)